MGKLSHVIRAVTAACLVAAVALGGAACGKGASASTLTVWGQDMGPGYRKAVERVVAEYEKKSDKQVNWIWKSYSQIVASQKLALSGPKAPDIIQTTQGWSQVSLVKAGLLVDLDDYAKKYGWDDRFPTTTREASSATADGKYFGKGNLYGVSDWVSFVGYFYNQQVLDELGLPVPTTMAEFEQALAAAKAKGIVPIQQGFLVQSLYAVLSQYVDKDTLTEFTYGNGDASLQTPEAERALRTFVRWAEKGYFQRGYLSVKDTDTQPLDSFLNGKGLFYAPGGPILYSTIADAKRQDDVGFLLQPPLSKGAPPTTTGAPANPFCISTKSKQQDDAAEFIDFLTNPQAQQRLGPTAGFVATDTSVLSKKKDAPKTLTELDSAYEDVARDGMVPWLDFASPDMYTVLTAQVAKLVAGKVTPEEFLSTVQQNQQTHISSLKR